MMGDEQPAGKLLIIIKFEKLKKNWSGNIWMIPDGANRERRSCLLPGD